MLQLPLLEMPSEPRFDGITCKPERDGKRLNSQLEAVRRLMLDHEWRTIPAIALHLRLSQIPCTEASVSARLRDLRKERFGGYNVERQLGASDGLWEYRIVPEVQR